MILVVLAIMWGIAAPRYANSMSRYRAEAAARRIASDFALARAQAKQTSTNVIVVFDTVANGYSMNGVQSLDHKSNVYSVNLTNDPYQATLVTVPFVSNQVTFNAYGGADQSGTVVVQAGGYQRTVVLEATSGKATVP
jgi:Tfp pilus assembly protein FimT